MSMKMVQHVGLFVVDSHIVEVSRTPKLDMNIYTCSIRAASAENTAHTNPSIIGKVPTSYRTKTSQSFLEDHMKPCSISPEHVQRSYNQKFQASSAPEQSRTPTTDCLSKRRKSNDFSNASLTRPFHHKAWIKDMRPSMGDCAILPASRKTTHLRHKPARRSDSKSHSMTELLNIDARIYSLEAEINGCDPSLVRPSHLAARYDDLVGLYVRKSEITRQPGDRDAATRNNTMAIQTGRLAMAEEYTQGLESEDVGTNWCFQGARLAWRSQAVGDHGSGSGTSIPTLIDSLALDEAIEAYDHALRELPSRRSSLRREAALNRANLLGARFEVNGAEADIDDAIENGEAALAELISLRFPSICNDVGVLYQQRGQLYNNVNDLQRAIELGLISLEEADCPQRIRVERSLNLYVSRKHLYDLTRQTQQLQQARIELLAVANLSERGRGYKRSHLLGRLATLAYLLSVDTGIAEYQIEAIRFAQEGLASARTDGISDEHAELILVMANALSHTDPQGRSAEELGSIIADGGNPF